MLRVCFNCYGSYTTDTVFQWDLNHILEIRGLTVDHAPTVHFCNRKSETAIVVQSEIDGDAITAPVPNQLLQEPYNIIAYVHVYDENHAKTVEIVNIPLTKRVKPDDYQFTENVDVMSFERLEKDITDFIALMDERYEDQNNEIESFEDRVSETLASIKRETLTIDGRLPVDDPENERSVIKPRRGTATLWSQANPVLAEGEIGIELPEDDSDFIKIKIGDGVKAWNELPYGVAPLSIIDNLTSTNTDLPLSANQGRVLKTDVDSKLPKSGGQITGNITGTQNGFKIDPTGDIYSDKWGSKWLSTALAEKLAKTGFTASRALVTNANGSVAVSNVTKEEIDCLDGVTSNIQTQIDDAQSQIDDAQSQIDDAQSQIDKMNLYSTNTVKNVVEEASILRFNGLSLSPQNFPSIRALLVAMSSSNCSIYMYSVTSSNTFSLLKVAQTAEDLEMSATSSGMVRVYRKSSGEYVTVHTKLIFIVGN